MIKKTLLSTVIIFLFISICSGRIIYRENFDKASGLSVKSIGWTVQKGDIKIAYAKETDSKSVDGRISQSDIINTAFIRIKKQQAGRKYIMTFKAVALPGAHCSSAGFGYIDHNGKVKSLVCWVYANGQWMFDARNITKSIPGQRNRFPQVLTGTVNKPVICKIVVDSGGYWIWGTITDNSGTVHRTGTFELPYSGRNIIDAVQIVEDCRSGSGPILVDDIVIEESDPPAVSERLNPKHRKYSSTIIEYSWSSADTKYIHDNIADMEKRPLDGITVRIAHPRFPHGNVLAGTGRGDIGWDVFKKGVHLDHSIIEPAIKDLRTTKFSRFRSNYLIVISYLDNVKTINWFDDKWWNDIIHNINLLAETAKKGGCEGLVFDPEEYGCAVWNWSELLKNPAYKGKTYEQVRKKVRQRGKAFAEAINQAYPGINILVLHAWEDSLSVVADDFTCLKSFSRGYIVAFLDGMLEGSDNNTKFMDGIENGYYISTPEEFRIKAQRVRWYGPKISAVPKLFRKKVCIGFGVWLDRNSKWIPQYPKKNFWQPTELSDTIASALSASDGFVWLYSERATWWLDLPTAKLGGGINLGTGVGNHSDRNTIIKYIPHIYWKAVDRARKITDDKRKNNLK